MGHAGGIYNSTGMVTLSGSTVEGNTATRVGGGSYNSAGGTVTLNDSTVPDNTAYRGGGIYNTGMVTLTRSTMRSNRPGNCFPPGSVPDCTG